MITCHKEMSCHGHVTFATPTEGLVSPPAAPSWRWSYLSDGRTRRGIKPVLSTERAESTPASCVTPNTQNLEIKASLVEFYFRDNMQFVRCSAPCGHDVGVGR
jgi:hypothetical protein